MRRAPPQTRVPSVCPIRLAAQGSPQLSQPLSDSISSPSPTPQLPSPSGSSEQHPEDSIWGPRPQQRGASLEKGAFSSAVLEPSSGVGSPSLKTFSLDSRGSGRP